MEWVWLIVTLLVVGLIIGGLAKLVLPGHQATSMFGTALAGIAGSFVGGLVGRLLFGPLEWWAALLLAILGAALFLAPYTVRARRTVT